MRGNCEKLEKTGSKGLINDVFKVKLSRAILFTGFLLLTGIIVTGTAYAAEGDILWQNNYGGANYDGTFSAQETTDGGYILCGHTTSFGNGYQVYLVKVASDGTLQWQNNYGGTGDEYISFVELTSDGGYIITGHTTSFGNGYQVYLVKVASDGTLQWQNNYGGTDYEHGGSVRQTTDGGYLITGSTNSFGNDKQVYLVKVASDGTLQWQNNYGAAGEDRGDDMLLTSDGGYIITGTTEAFGNAGQVYLFKVASDGTLQWQNNYGGASGDDALSIHQTTDGGYIISGVSYSFGNWGQIYLVKVASDGTLQWQNNYGGTGDEYGWSVDQTTDGGYIVTSSTSSSENGNQAFLVKVASDGTLQWQNNYGGTGRDDSYVVMQTKDGNYIFTGVTYSFGNDAQAYLVKVSGGMPQLKVVPESVTTVTGYTKSFNIVLGTANDGLAGYDLRLTLNNTSVASVTDVTWPSWAQLTRTTTVSPGEIRISAADLNNEVQPGATDVTLATVTLQCDMEGDANLNINGYTLDDDNGNLIQLITMDGSLIVNDIQPFPGSTQKPIDLDGDGLYEDVNGNNRLDFNDIVLYYQHMDWIRNNQDIGVEPYDYNNNGVIDFDDVVAHYDELLEEL